jgi:putative Holliday junction resolvase
MSPGAPEPGIVLGLDLGDARIGVAASDPARRVAPRRSVIRVGSSGGPDVPATIEQVAMLAEAHGATCVVVGEPVSMDGTRGPRALAAAAFADHLGARLGIPVALQDERLSTVEATRGLRDAALPARLRKRTVDAEAARLILQAWLDRQPPA